MEPGLIIRDTACIEIEKGRFLLSLVSLEFQACAANYAKLWFLADLVSHLFSAIDRNSFFGV